VFSLDVSDEIFEEADEEGVELRDDLMTGCAATLAVFGNEFV
jgi:hypothetical protein